MQRTVKGHVRTIRKKMQGVGVITDGYGVLVLRGLHYRNEHFTVAVLTVMAERPDVFRIILRFQSPQQVLNLIADERAKTA